jgi:hypothetical protein
MTHPPIPFGSSPFDAIRHEDEHGEWWSARELAKILSYDARDSWRNFENVIKKAMTACKNSEHQVSDHIVETDNMIAVGKGAQRQVRDYRLTRYACYLVAQNADPAKEIVAQAQTYFAVQTRRQEVADEEANFLEWRERAIASYVNSGRSVEWARLRVDGITIRNKLTHEWSVRGIKGGEFAILTDTLHMQSFGLSVQQHMGVKDFPVTYKGKRAVYKGELREALTDVETVITSLGESVARTLHIEHDSHGFDEIEEDIIIAGDIAADTRRQIEAATGKPVVSPRNMIKEPDGGLWGRLPSGDDMETA